MKVTLICPIYNEKDSISYLIESMLNQSKKPDEIIFVDDTAALHISGSNIGVTEDILMTEGTVYIDNIKLIK